MRPCSQALPTLFVRPEIVRKPFGTCLQELGRASGSQQNRRCAVLLAGSSDGLRGVFITCYLVCGYGNAVLSHISIERLESENQIGFLLVNIVSQPGMYVLEGVPTERATIAKLKHE